VTIMPIPTNKGGTPNRLKRSSSSTAAKASANGAVNVMGFAASLWMVERLSDFMAPGITEKPNELRLKIAPVSMAVIMPLACP